MGDYAQLPPSIYSASPRRPSPSSDLAEELRRETPPMESCWLEATVGIEDELWSTEVRARTPPPTLLGVNMDTSVRPLRSWLGKDDPALSDFLSFADASYRKRRRLERTVDEASDRLGPELLLMYMGPYLARECASLPNGSAERVLGAIASFSKLLHRMREDGAIEESCWEEFRGGFYQERSKIATGISLVTELKELYAAPAQSPAGNIRSLLRIESAESEEYQLESRDGERVHLHIPDSANRLPQGWWLDLSLSVGKNRSRPAAIHGLFPPCLARFANRM